MTKTELYFTEVEGIKIPPFFSKELFESALKFKPKSGDIIISTYPKCGTTWMQYLVLNILRRGKKFENPKDFFKASPFLDQLGAEDSEQLMIKPGAYKTHLPFYKVPWSEDAKYIYVARNPKDCCVSFYHHMNQIPAYQFSEATFDEFFDRFINGDLEFNDYFDHVLSWYSERNRKNVFFTTYEEMKRNLRETAIKVANFINENEAKYLEENPDVLDKIVQNCSFQEMKFINDVLNILYNKPEDVLADPHLPKGRKHIATYVSNLPSFGKTNINFIRKGEVGGWKSVLSENQVKLLNERMFTKFENSDIMDLWKNAN